MLFHDLNAAFKLSSYNLAFVDFVSFYFVFILSWVIFEWVFYFIFPLLLFNMFISRFRKMIFSVYFLMFPLYTSRMLMFTLLLELVEINKIKLEELFLFLRQKKTFGEITQCNLGKSYSKTIIIIYWDITQFKSLNL